MHSNTLQSFVCLGFVVLVVMFQPALSSGSGKHENGEELENSEESVEAASQVQAKYYFTWSSPSRRKPKPSGTSSPETSCMSNITCKIHNDCFQCFPNINMAFRSGMPSGLAYYPICSNRTRYGHSRDVPRCTCGAGMCVSYSTDHDSGKDFYYCGPCGHVGASCMKYPCSDKVAECRQGYCKCIDDGIYYDMAYCYIPYFGVKMIVQMFLVTLIIVVLLGVMAYSYHRLNRSRRSIFSRFERRRDSEVRESPPDDTPPTYDDVVDKVPSYQDAIEIEKNNNNGHTNLAYVDDSDGRLPPTYEESENSIITNNHPGAVGPSDDRPIIANEATATTQESSQDNQSENNDTPSTTESLPDDRSQTTEPPSNLEVQHQPIEQPIRSAMGE